MADTYYAAAAVCRARGCTEPATTRYFCETHYRRKLHMRIFGYRDPEAARRHVTALRGLGWTYEQIAEAAQVSTWVPHQLTTGGTRAVWPESERAVLAVPLAPRPSHRGVDGTGTYRRLEGLQWMGWPLAKIAAELGLQPNTLVTLRSRGEMVSFRVAQAMADLYGRWSHLPGPSKQTATKARRRGFAPPAAWDDERIDDPAAQPEGTDPERVTLTDRYLDARSVGYQPWEAAKRAGISLTTARQVECRTRAASGVAGG